MALTVDPPDMLLNYVLCSYEDFKERTPGRLVEGLCSRCDREFKDRHFTPGCQALWEKLPAAFELGTWDELRAAAERAIAGNYLDADDTPSSNIMSQSKPPQVAIGIP